MSERIRIRVVPNAKKSCVVCMYGEALKVKIAAPAMDGKANAELVKFVSKTLSLSKSCVRIITGDTAHDKLIEIDCDDALKKLLATVD